MSSNCTISAVDSLHAVIAGCRAELAGLYAEVAADGAKKMRRWQDESPMLESYIQGVNIGALNISLAQEMNCCSGSSSSSTSSAWHLQYALGVLQGTAGASCAHPRIYTVGMRVTICICYTEYINTDLHA
jgi:hypothetical protein